MLLHRNCNLSASKKDAMFSFSLTLSYVQMTWNKKNRINEAILVLPRQHTQKEGAGHSKARRMKSHRRTQRSSNRWSEPDREESRRSGNKRSWGSAWKGNSTTLLEIYTPNADLLKMRESFYGGTVSPVEWNFLEEQRSEKKMGTAEAWGGAETIIRYNNKDKNND